MSCYVLTYVDPPEVGLSPPEGYKVRNSRRLGDGWIRDWIREQSNLSEVSWGLRGTAFLQMNVKLAVQLEQDLKAHHGRDNQYIMNNTPHLSEFVEAVFRHLDFNERVFLYENG